MNRQNGGVDGTVSAKRISGSATPFGNIAGSVFASRGGGTKEVYSDTTANWNARSDLIGKKDCLYVYTDYAMDGDTPIASIKVGDGNAYLIDLPFIYSGNVTQEQIDFWNNKVTVYEEYVDSETLFISKD